MVAKAEKEDARAKGEDVDNVYIGVELSVFAAGWTWGVEESRSGDELGLGIDEALEGEENPWVTGLEAKAANELDDWRENDEVGGTLAVDAAMFALELT